MGLNKRLIPTFGEGANGVEDINPWGDGSQISFLKFDGSLYDTQRNTNISWSGTPCYSQSSPDGTGNAISAKNTKDSYSNNFLPNSLTSSGYSFSFWYNVNLCNLLGSWTESNEPIISIAYLDIFIQFSGRRIEMGYDLTPQIASNYEFTNRNYHHVVCQGAGTNIQIYVDGTLKDSRNTMVYTNEGSGDYLFRHWRTNTAYWPEQGTISHLRTFNRKLTQDEITQLSQVFD
jgi:hypothetical protein